MSKFTRRDVSIVRFVTSGGLALKNGFYSSKSPSVTKRRPTARAWDVVVRAEGSTEEATELPGG